MSEEIIILMIGVSTFLGALGLLALIWAVKTGQFDDYKKFTNAVHHDNEEDLQDAAMLAEKRKAYKKKIKQEIIEKEKNYRPTD
jgi:cbb3-type cytochrome oxidase maturation protein